MLHIKADLSKHFIRTGNKFEHTEKSFKKKNNGKENGIPIFDYICKLCMKHLKSIL